VEKSTLAPAATPATRFKYVNIIVRGAFGYRFDTDCIWACAPAVFGHEYYAGVYNMMEMSNWPGG